MCSVPELERLLRRSSRGEMGFENWQLLGVELLELLEVLELAVKHYDEWTESHLEDETKLDCPSCLLLDMSLAKS